MLLLIAIGLSMDAFSLSLAYGTLNICKKDIFLISIIVGIYHFFMPQLGHSIFDMINNFFILKTNLLTAFILFLLGLQMLFKKDNKKVKKMYFLEMLLFGLAVSIDSFSIGIGLKSITNNTYLASLIFSITSFLFTFIGLIIGKKISEKIGEVAPIIGGVLLLILGFYYVFS